MTKITKSLVRHVLTALGMVLGIVGLGDMVGFIDILISDVDQIWDGVAMFIGFFTSYKAFFTDKERFDDTEAK